ncbi:MAG: dap4 2, partial [Candidatus Aminicenantes bacterium]|nr:dap4 2 [Candidatus Aminicenantes bacterium]
QVGPEKGSGVRHNGQNLDLNRDSMKLESPEMRGLVRNVLLRWDPLLLVDCHTTDGSFHQEPVTYSWPLCPNGDPAVLKYARDKMLPAIDATLEKKYGTLSVPYGDPMDFRDMEKGWRTFGHQPRYMTNYIGLRNRLSILDENYNYADFRTRVAGNYHLLKAILDYCAANAAELQKLVADADARTVQAGLAPAETDTFGLDIDVQPLPDKLSVLGYVMEAPSEPAPGGQGAPPFPRMRPTDKTKTYVMPYYADFIPKRSVRLPFAYLVPLAGTEVLEKLRQHGLSVERLTEAATLEVEAFRLKEIKGAERLYQGHRTNTVTGEYAVEKREFPSGIFSTGTSSASGAAGRRPTRPTSC